MIGDLQYKVLAETLIFRLPVVVLADLAHGHQRLQVLVGLEGVDIVQRAAVPRVSVRRREVDGHLQTRAANQRAALAMLAISLVKFPHKWKFCNPALFTLCTKSTNL